MIADNEGMEFCIMIAMIVGMYGGMGLFGPLKKRRRVMAGANETVITAAMKNYREVNYKSMILLFKGAGFTNVTAVPLRDLNLLNQLKNGKVEAVTINGNSEFEEGDVFLKSANVVITYHSR